MAVFPRLEVEGGDAERLSSVTDAGSRVAGRAEVCVVG